MTWRSLLQTLSDKPDILAGPMLRQITSHSVTVWFVLKRPAKVHLSVTDTSGAVVLTGERMTYAIGTNLHMVAVTAGDLAATTPKLVEGQVYLYNPTFDFYRQGYDYRTDKDPPLATGVSLAAASKGAKDAQPPRLHYPPYNLPSFCLPPSDINKLRLMHGSCRHSNGQGEDSLALLDALINETAATADLRPHQLLLTGDQIYADDVSATHLLWLRDAADVLLGWKEILPVDEEHGGAREGSKIPPYYRMQILEEAGFTSDAADNHLMSLGEYICMYLYVWSDVLWDDPEHYPTNEDVMKMINSEIKGPTLTDAMSEGSQISPLEKAWERAAITLSSDTTNFRNFRKKLPEVRRALANIPTYMILDDHEVTDDFHMTRSICEGIYGNPLGRRIMQNGLVAYTLCQHWGNAPQKFLGMNAPGLTLLDRLHMGNADTYAERSVTTDMVNIQKLVGVHDVAQLRNPVTSTPNVFAVYHDENMLTFHYTIECFGHQIIVTDSRTCRSFPYGPDEAPELMPAEQIQRQIVQTPALNGRAMIVVVSTNAPPAPIIRYAPENQRKTRVVQAPDRQPDFFDSWELPSDPFDRLMNAVSDKLMVKDANQKEIRTGCAVFLSGDVHAGFASRLLYSGTARFQDPAGQNKPVHIVVGQLVSSSLRNQTSSTVDQHNGGYSYPGFALGETTPPEGYVGWNFPVGTSKEVGGLKHSDNLTYPVFSKKMSVTGSKTLSVRQESSWIRGTKNLVMTDAFITPDYGYRLDYIVADQQSAVTIFGQDKLRPIAAGATPQERESAKADFHKITKNYRQYSTNNSISRDMVGVTHLGEVTFGWSATADKFVHQTLRWKNVDLLPDSLIIITTYTVPLNPDYKSPSGKTFLLSDVIPKVVKP